MSKRFQHDRHNPGGVAVKKSTEKNELDLSSYIKLSVKYAATMTVENESLVVYHSLRNTRRYHEATERGLEFDFEDAEAVEKVLKSKASDDPIQVNDLPCEADEDKLRIAKFLVQETIAVKVAKTDI